MCRSHVQTHPWRSGMHVRHEWRRKGEDHGRENHHCARDENRDCRGTPGRFVTVEIKPWSRINPTAVKSKSASANSMTVLMHQIQAVQIVLSFVVFRSSMTEMIIPANSKLSFEHTLHVHNVQLREWHTNDEKGCYWQSISRWTELVDYVHPSSNLKE